MSIAEHVDPDRRPRFVHLPSLALAAAMAPALGGRGGASYLDLPCRSLLNRCDSPGMPFEWTINPYRGCEFGCRYCYARYTHAFIGIEDPRLFETRIYAKRGAAEALGRDLVRLRGRPGAIAIGTATDAYQPAERAFGVTRRILELLARQEGLSLSITTKSDLVTRDLDLLCEIGRRNRLEVNLTITTPSRRLARLLEPRAPEPARRLEAVGALARKGISTGVMIMPVLPGITDAPDSLEAIIAAAARRGAARVVHQVLFLRSSTREAFDPFLAERFPRLAPRYRRIYGGTPFHSIEYRARVRGLVHALRRSHGFGDPEEDRQGCAERAVGLTARCGSEPRAAGDQLALGF